MSESLKEIEAEIVDEFGMIEDPMMRYEFIIDIGKDLPPLADEYKTEENIVKGCQSTVWVASLFKDGRVYFKADSNTVITKGIIALLVRVLSGQKPEDIVNADLEFIDKIDLRSHLSSQRSNGLTAMVRKMKGDAAAFQSQSKEQAT